MKVKGEIHEIFETQTLKNDFRKREVVIKTKEQYPQYLKIEFIKENTDLLNNFEKGDIVEIDINLKGGKWKDPKDQKEKYFNSLQGWRIEKV